MGKGRLEAFSDGVLAIIITIMVLELKVPEGYDWESLQPLLPKFLLYILSFVNVGIYWNNHHHLMHAVRHVNGTSLWANLHLLFWLSLIPFTTAWMGEHHDKTWPVITYTFVLLMAGVAYYFLVKSLVKDNHELKDALGSDWKEKISVIIYSLGIVLGFYQPLISLVLVALVAAIWFIPDSRIEKKIVYEQEK